MHFCHRLGNCQGVPLRLYGVDIPLEQSVRFLGVQLDRKITYKHHLKSLRLKCMKVLNLLKCVARTSYGADRATLLLLYRSLIRSKLDYACIVYNRACASHKRILDTVHHTALRVVTGALRASAISSILADAHEPPLSRRRYLLSMRYACKLRQFPNHPTYAYVFSRHVLAVFESNATMRIVPFCVRVRSLLQEANIAPRDIARASHTRLPPWQLATPVTDLSLSHLQKSVVLPAELSSKALELIAPFTDRQHIYTDGSKRDVGVGCAFVCGSATRTFTLSPQATVFTAELLAIHKALCFIEVSDDTYHVIFTDSFSSLLAMSDFNTFHPVLQDILVLLTTLDRDGKSDLLLGPEPCWHHRNERADEAAKRASRGQRTRFQPLPASDLLAVCSSHVRLKWQEDWESSGSSKLKVIKPRLAAWSFSLRTSRREEVQLCHLRIGRTLATHRYLLCGNTRHLLFLRR